MGSGFRTFTAGEVLTASNVQNYLQDQVVMTFAGSAARSSAIGTANFEEGMISYLTDTDKVEAYNGTNWVQVGSSNQGLTLINTTSFSGVASQSINDVFSATYDHYKILLRLTAASTDLTVNFRFRVSGADNTTSNYNKVGWYVGSDASSGNGNSLSQSLFQLGTFDTTNPTYHLHDILISLPFSTDYTQFQSTDGYKSQGGTHFSEFNSNWFNATTSFTGFSVYASTGNITGSVSTFGINK